MPPSLAPNPGGGLSTASVTRCALRSRFSFRTRFRQADACGNTAPAGTLVAPGIPGGNSPATPVFAGIVRDKFPGNPSIGQHNPDALCNHAHRQTPDARHTYSYPGASAIPPPAHCVGDPATGSTEDPSSTVPFVSGRGLPSCTQHRLVCILRRAAVDPIALPAARR